MARPGTQVTLTSTPSSASVSSDSGAAFFVGETDLGPLLAQPIRSLAEFVSTYGTRQAYSPLYDSLEAFFAEGGNNCHIARVVGPNPTLGTHNLLDGVAAVSLIATAIGPGAWSANYKVAVVAGVGAGTYRVQVTDAVNNVLEDSGDLPDQISAQQWSQFSKYIRITIGASALIPVVAAPVALSAGTDDRVNIADAQWLNALNQFSIDLGPGQVAAPGRTTTTGHAQLVAHAEANRRVAIMDLADTASDATLEAAAGAARSRFAAAFAPWVVIPGLTSTTLRTIPPSGVVCGIIARNDPSLGTDHPSAGRFGVSNYAIDLSQPDWTDAIRQTMSLSGVDVIRRISGDIRIYGWRSTTDPATDADWLDFGNARLFNMLATELDAVAENYVFDDIDGQDGSTIGGFHDDLAGVCMRHFTAGELFGDTADEAFSVDTGHGVNTLQTIQNLELHATVAVRMAAMAEFVAINIVKRSITQSV